MVDQGKKYYRHARPQFTRLRLRSAPSSRAFGLDETLWPHFKKLSATLDEYLAEVTASGPFSLVEVLRRDRGR